jgi:hypothetical protein
MRLGAALAVSMARLAIPALWLTTIQVSAMLAPLLRILQKAMKCMDELAAAWLAARS